MHGPYAGTLDGEVLPVVSSWPYEELVLSLETNWCGLDS